MKILILCVTTLISLTAFSGLKLVSYNIRNFDYDERQHIPTNKNALYTIIKGLDADLIGVQEIVNAPEFVRFIQQYFPQYGVALTTCGGQNNQKLGFIYNKNKLKITAFSQDLRLASSDPSQQGVCNMGSRPAAIAYFYNMADKYYFSAIAVHLKSGGQDRSIAKRQYQMKILSQIVSDIRTAGINDFVIMGDFNTTEYIFKGNIYNTFRRTIMNMQLRDLSEYVNCTAYWPGQNMNDNTFEPSALDHILVSNRILNGYDPSRRVVANGHCATVQCRKATPQQLGLLFNEVSDHCPLSADFR